MLAPLLNERSRPDVLAVVHGTVHCGERLLDDRFGPFSRRLVGLLIMGLPSREMRGVCQALYQRSVNSSKAGRIRPVIDKVFPFEQAKEALGYLVKGRAKGKVVVQMRR